MIGLGTIVNMVVVAGGALIGIIIKGGLKERFEKNIMTALGLSVMFIGITGALEGLLYIENSQLKTHNIMLMILSLAIGAFIGEAINVEKKLEGFGGFCKRIFKINGSKGDDFVEGFVNSSLLFCVGAMAIIGSLQDGLLGDPSMLFAKSIIDGIAAVIFASTLGIGVAFSIIPLGIYQGGITFAARFIEPYLNEGLIMNISFIGSILIFAIGVNIIFGKKIKTGNLLPAILIPIIYQLIRHFI